MSWKGSRTRNIRRVILFTEEEWKTVSMRYQAEQQKHGKTFSSWARNTLMEPFNVTITVNADTDKLNEQITGIANNINQIARKVNIAQTADKATLVDLLGKLEAVQKILILLQQENRNLIEQQLTMQYSGKE